MDHPILKLENYAVSFDTPQGEVQAVRGVDISVGQGEILCIVGESGCGKTVMCQSIMKLLPRNSRVKSGRVILDGEDITDYKEKQMRSLRGSQVSMVFQDPMMTLNPTIPVGRQITEAILKHRRISRSEARARAIEMMELVGIDDAEERFRLQPHFFSGGMRQRCVLATVLALSPRLLLADEPTTALDVTVEARILDLLRELRDKTGVSIIFVSHDLGAVARIADRVAVMYAGRIVETGTADEVFYDPRHPYTWGLMSSLPTLAGKDGRLRGIPGMPPQLLDPPPGDAFAERNEYALAIDYEEMPPMFPVTGTHYAATWLLDSRAPRVEPPISLKGMGSCIWNPSCCGGSGDAGGEASYTQEGAGDAGGETARAQEGAGDAGGEAVHALEAVGDAGGVAAHAPEGSRDAGRGTAHAPEESGDAERVASHAPEGAGHRTEGRRILEVRNLVQHFPVHDAYTARAVNGISFEIYENEVLGLVGETGCGKSTVARTVAGIYHPTGGEVFYDGEPVSGKEASRQQRRKMQGQVQMVFQDSAAALNPRMTVKKILLEPLKIQKRLGDRAAVGARLRKLLELVGLPEACLSRHPDELSGGQRQRIAIARSLMLDPRLLIADEPVASLDVSIQAQIISLLMHCKEEHRLSMLFIAHDLSVVRFISDRVAVMLKGRLVEVAPAEELFANPLHPYTRSLLSAVHTPDPVYERTKKLFPYDRNLPLGTTMREQGEGHLVLV